MKISLIAAMSTNRVIGKDNDLVWHMPADLKFFKKTTIGHHILMGRKTFESFGKALPGRTNLVLTGQRDVEIPGATVVHSMEDAISLAQAAGEEELFIGGGAKVYEESLSIADRIYLTLIHHTFEGHAFFPVFDVSEWKEVSREDHAPDEKNPYAYSFLLLERK
ncbi:MAG: dihydrofolate reductase [Bacteroidia bacterium]